MKIIIFTLRDHVYGNYIMKQLLLRKLLRGHQVIVFEQEGLLPDKSKFKGLMKYLENAGWDYTCQQTIKQLLFYLVRYIRGKQKKYSSNFYPYFGLRKSTEFKRQACPDLKSKEAEQLIKDFRPDLIISIFSKEIIPEAIIETPKYGCVNLHPALLPFYRGISPTFWCLANNEPQAGISLHYIDKSIDTGKIISQAKFKTSRFKTEHGLYMNCSKLGFKLLTQLLRELQTKREVATIVNPKNGSYYSLPTKVAVRKFRKNGYAFFKVEEFLI